jgi:hypothetical protein
MSGRSRHPSVCFAWRTASNALVGFPAKRRRRDELNRSLFPTGSGKLGLAQNSLIVRKRGGLSADDSVRILPSRLIHGERPIGNCNNNRFAASVVGAGALLFVRDQEGACTGVSPRLSTLGRVAIPTVPYEERYLLYNRASIPPGEPTGQERRDRVERNADRKSKIGDLAT